MNPKTDNHVLNIWYGQTIHFFGLVVLLALVWAAWGALGWPFAAAFWGAIAIPILHQVFVWIAWRLELRSSVISKTIGWRLYLFVFFALFFGRFATVAILAFLDRGSLGFCPFFGALLTAVLAVPSAYAIYSVHRFFGPQRAAGADHFYTRYRNMPLVKKGIFRYTKNGMYLYAFLSFWAIAIGFNSAAALVVAAFSHAYIWIHYFATEKPDMDYIYGSPEKT